MIHRDPPEDRCSALSVEALRSIAFQSALAKTRDPDRADDIAGEFSEAWVEHGVARFPRVVDVRMYVRDRWIDQSRRESVRQSIPLEGSCLDSAGVHSRSALDLVAEQELLEHVASGLDGQLSDREQRQLLGVIDGSASASETARSLGIPARTGRRQASKTIEFVRAKLVARFGLNPQFGLGAWLAWIVSPKKWKAVASSRSGFTAASFSVLSGAWLPILVLFLVCGLLSLRARGSVERGADVDTMEASALPSLQGASASEPEVMPLLALVPARRPVEAVEADSAQMSMEPGGARAVPGALDALEANFEFQVRVVDGDAQPIRGLTGDVRALSDPGGVHRYKKIEGVAFEETTPGCYLFKGRRVDQSVWFRIHAPEDPWYLHFVRSEGAAREVVDVVVDVVEREFRVELPEGEGSASPCASYGCVSEVGENGWIVATARRDYAHKKTIGNVAEGRSQLKDVVATPYAGVLFFSSAPRVGASIRAFDRNSGPGDWAVHSFNVSD